MQGAVVFLTLVAGISAAAETFQALPEKQDSRIVSGWVARDGQFPYMLFIRAVRWTGDISGCGGSIIHRSWGLTSGSCTAQRVEVTAHAGSVNRNTPRVVIQVRDSFRPPEYMDELQPISQPNDISLIRFNRDLNFDNFIQPIRLQRSADMNRNYEGVRMTTSGWGSTWTCTIDQPYCPTPDVLNWVHLRGITNFMCQLLYNSNFLIRQSTICAGPYNVTSQSICWGDSGVPLTTIDDDGRPSQIGVGSFTGPWGCHVGWPGAFTRPGFFHGWMRQVTGINFDWNRSAAEDTPTDENNPLLYHSNQSDIEV